MKNTHMHIIKVSYVDVVNTKHRMQSKSTMKNSIFFCFLLKYNFLILPCISFRLHSMFLLCHGILFLVLLHWHFLILYKKNFFPSSNCVRTGEIHLHCIFQIIWLRITSVTSSFLMSFWSLLLLLSLLFAVFHHITKHNQWGWFWYFSTSYEQFQ